MASPYHQPSRTCADALTEYDEAFRSALVMGEVTPWAAAFGRLKISDALRTVYPLPLDAAGYKEFKGDIKYRSLYLRQMAMTTKTWTDGVAEFAKIIEAPDFIGWESQPAEMALEWLRLENEMTALMLAESSFAGPLLDLYKDPDIKSASTIRLFSASHLVNALDASKGTFTNILTTTVADIQSGKAFDDINDHFRTIKKPNGKKGMGLTLNGGKLLVPSTRDTLFKKALEHDTLVQAVSDLGVVGASADVVAAVTQPNLHKGTITRYVAEELESENYFYAQAAGRPGCVPWIIQKQAAPEEIRRDKDSDFYKEKLKVSLAYVGDANVGAALPHATVRVEITG